MNTIEAIRAVLIADATVTGLVAARIHANVAPQANAKAVPVAYVICQVISDVPQSSFEGQPSTTLRNARVQIDCYAPTYTVAQSVAEAIDAALSASASPDLACWRESSRDLYDNETQLHRVSVDMSVWR